MDQGQGSLSMTVDTKCGKRIVLNLRLNLKSISMTGSDIIVDNTGIGTYWKKGEMPQVIYFDSIKYTYHTDSKLVDVEASNPLKFKVTGLKATEVM
jgi:hypothetical protein